MRSLLLLLPLLAACGPDPVLGTFNFMVTGTDNQTTPTTQTSTASGAGTIAITKGLMDQNYDITIAQAGATACTIHGTPDPKDALTVDITAGSTCALQFAGGNATATMGTNGTATVKQDALTMSVTYTYTGTTIILNQTFAGSGSRTYTGPRI
jgi:hypothetical protein